MPSDNNGTNRRSVLKTTGLALAGITGMSGAASAAPGKNNGNGHGHGGPNGLPPQASEQAAQRVRVAGRDELPEPAAGWGNGAPQAPPEDVPRGPPVDGEEKCLGFTENGCRVDYSKIEVEESGGTRVEEQLVVTLPNGEVAVARPKNGAHGKLPDELRPEEVSA